MDGPPPPPPPHGENPHTTDGEYRKSSDLPPGNYDIFIVPPHSSGGGFLYLPSLQCHRNSFLAGAASTLLVVILWSLVAPTVKTWYIASVSNGPGGMGMMVVALGLGVAGWAFGMSQSNSRGDGDNNGNGNGSGGRFGGGFSGGAGRNANDQSSGSNRNSGSNFGGNGSGHRQQRSGNFGGGQYGNQYAGNQHGTEAPPNAEDEENGKEKEREREREREKEKERQKEKEREDRKKAETEREREEAKRKEDLRRKMEEFKRKRDAEAKEKERKREREAMEKELKERREQLEREMAAARDKAEKEARERLEREAAEARAKQAKAAADAKAETDRLAKEAKEKADKLAAEAKEKAAKEAAEKEAAAKEKAQKEAMAKFAALKEAAAKRYAEKKAQEAKSKAQQPAAPASATSAPRTPSPKKQPPFPTANTTIEDDAYSFRPYDRPRRPYGKESGSGSAYSESSYAPSQSTARTTPPPSHRSTYSTKDPDKIVIQGVYQFNNAFMKTPVAQLVSGQGMVTDGLVLRMTTEGLFVDDDLRGVGQREWDVKAWTLKLAEIWCPQVGSNNQTPKPGSSNPFSFRRGASANSMPTNEESEAFATNLLKVCKNTCRLASPSACFARGSNASGGGPVQPPQAEFRGLHILRASIRDQEGKKYVFVLQDTEAWKLAMGLQRLRGGALVRALGVSALPVPECKSILGGLGYI
ncbi:hypothetical protein N7481_010935 [Penicillium waksmanii]|uniref:uncharacterized protein n=1 Tax=Penicillium waksmanii TaxID=69791 RepID=UPI00254729D2|nr:uncharacterized protein N7481_010935 [Penicillium waksmanii]KAJ5973725.1 hypothetical protein N7481_010935 [Penicillium waksmanii]